MRQVVDEGRETVMQQQMASYAGTTITTELIQKVRLSA